MTMDEYFLTTFKSHWVKDEYNLGILSAFYTEPWNIAKMVQLFSLKIWSLILISTLAIMLFNTLFSRLTGSLIYQDNVLINNFA